MCHCVSCRGELWSGKQMAAMTGTILVGVNYRLGIASHRIDLALAFINERHQYEYDYAYA